MIKSISIFLVLIVCCQKLFANDGSFRGSGNQLIPIQETDISVKKEVLTIKRIDENYVDISVYYEFFNPRNEKEITVGFEAFSPEGDVDGRPENGQHPYMTNFTVNMNDERLKYRIAYVNDSTYAKNGFIHSRTLKEVQDSIEDEQEVDFYYVYYFKAKFKNGLNILKHTYRFELSSSVVSIYDFKYILTAANRWGNKQIDDFTLILDLGNFEMVQIPETFFKNKDEWVINGMGKINEIGKDDYFGTDKKQLKFYIQRGTLIFAKKNFHPIDELYFDEPNNYLSNENGNKQEQNYLPFSIDCQDEIDLNGKIDKKILRNLPFARRGYIFKNSEFKKIYESMDWYIPNPSYIPDVASLDEREKKWLKKLN
jgi:hypothetical protein